MPSEQSIPLLPRWVCGLVCLVCMLTIPAVIAAACFFEAPPQTLLSLPPLAVVYFACQHCLMTGKVPPSLLRSAMDCLTCLVRLWRRRGDD